jgi:ABC-type multidrug transport system permease subunit
LEWVVILSLVTAVELALLWWGRRLFAAPLPALNVRGGRWAEPIMVAGASMAAYGLAFFAAEGFAPYGRFPRLTAAIFVVGVLLVALSPAGSHQRLGTPHAAVASRRRSQTDAK